MQCDAECVMLDAWWTWCTSCDAPTYAHRPSGMTHQALGKLLSHQLPTKQGASGATVLKKAMKKRSLWSAPMSGLTCPYLFF